jgi:hypothetical protein
MTPANFASYIRLKTKTNATTFPDADILAYANIIKDDIAKEVTKANEDYFGMKFLRNLIAGQRGYSFPSDVLNQIKYLQAKLDGIKQKVLFQFDVNTYKRPTNESEILANWSGKDAEFDIYGSSLYIYSDAAIIDVANGLELWAIIYPEDLASLAGTNDMSVPSTTTSFGMPRQLHYVWATKVIIEYKNSKEKPIPLTEKEANVEADQTLAINALKGQDLNRSIIATVSDSSNNGYDY